MYWNPFWGDVLFKFTYQKADSQRILKVDQDIKNLEKQHTEQQDSDTWCKLNELKCELNDILNRKTEFALLCTRQKYFEQGERAGNALVQRVKQIQSHSFIPWER